MIELASANHDQLVYRESKKAKQTETGRELPYHKLNSYELSSRPERKPGFPDARSFVQWGGKREAEGPAVFPQQTLSSRITGNVSS